MFTTNLLNIKRLKNTSPVNTINDVIDSTENANIWMNIKGVNNPDQLSELYQDVCQKHQHTKKWILMINPEDESLLQLSTQSKIDVSRILRVNTKNTLITINAIEKALSKGNCSAIILSQNDIKSHELVQLSNCAKQGQTQCIVLEKSITLH